MLVDPPENAETHRPPRATGSGRVADTGSATEARQGFLSARPPRRAPESALVRAVATGGIVGVGTALGALLGAFDVDPWALALVVSFVSVVLAAVLWRSRVL